MQAFDAVVIGGGPAGATAALYLLRAGVRTALVEKLTDGGQVLMTSELENYPGFPEGIQGFELADKLTAHLAQYPLERFQAEVKAIEPGEGVHRVVLDDEVIEARAVVIASGAKYKKLNVPGEEAYAGRGVSYCAMCDGNFFRGKVVAVVGGGNSALEEALYLARLVERIHLIHRREDFRGLKCYQDKCFVHPKINVHRSTVVEEIVGDDAGVNGVALKRVDTGEKTTLDVDGVFLFVGFDPIMDYVPEAVKRDARGLKVDLEMRTSVPGIFAAGDVISKNCRQVATAVGDGATAATAAFAYLEQLDA